MEVLRWVGDGFRAVVGTMIMLTPGIVFGLWWSGDHSDYPAVGPCRSVLDCTEHNLGRPEDSRPEVAASVSKVTWVSSTGHQQFLEKMATVGVLIAWRWEMIGGAIAVASATAISVLVYLGSRSTVFTAALMTSVPFFVAGVLFLTCCWRTRQTQL